MTFLQVGGSARGEALGGAFISIKGDPSVIFYNPAGVATIKGYAVYANRTNWIADIVMNHFAAVASVWRFTTGVTFMNMDYGDIVGTRIVDVSVSPSGYEHIGMLNPSSWALGGFYAMPLTDRFNFGVHVKYVRQDLGQNDVYTFTGVTPKYTGAVSKNRVGTFAVDLGTQYNMGLRNITINMALQHFASPQRYIDTQSKFDLPLTYRVGLAGDAIEIITGLENPVHKVMVYVDGMDQRDVVLDVAAGVEYLGDFSAMVPGLKVALRAGRRAARYQDGWLNFGGGIEFALGKFDARLDYAYSDYGPGLTANRLGLSLLVK